MNSNTAPCKLDFWQQEIQEGDLIFRHGYGVVSDWINSHQSSPFHTSHAGIVVNLNHKWVVIHSISGMLEAEDGVQVSTLRQFCSEARPESVFILRPQLSKKNRQIAIKKALYCLNKGIRFDHQFNVQEPTKMYCTEFVLFCFKHAGNGWSSPNPKKDFEILTDTALGRLIGPSLPWKETHMH